MCKFGDSLVLTVLSEAKNGMNLKTLAKKLAERTNTEPQPEAELIENVLRLEEFGNAEVLMDTGKRNDNTFGEVKFIEPIAIRKKTG